MRLFLISNRKEELALYFVGLNKSAGIVRFACAGMWKTLFTNFFSRKKLWFSVWNSEFGFFSGQDETQLPKNLWEMRIFEEILRYFKVLSNKVRFCEGKSVSRTSFSVKVLISGISFVWISAKSRVLWRKLKKSKETSQIRLSRWEVVEFVRESEMVHQAVDCLGFFAWSLGKPAILAIL